MTKKHFLIAFALVALMSVQSCRIADSEDTIALSSASDTRKLISSSGEEGLSSSSAGIKQNVFRVMGKVIDAQTGQGLPKTRIVVKGAYLNYPLLYGDSSLAKFDSAHIRCNPPDILIRSTACLMPPPPTDTILTDLKGIFVVDLPYIGEYNIEAFHEGYGWSSQHLTVDQLPGDTTLVIELFPKIADTTMACPMIYAPVCGVDGVTYGNACVAAASGVKVAYEGECKASDACPEYYDPVCGSDGVTYGNPCEAKRAGVRDYVPGKCPVDSCPKIYAPVCDVDNLKNYINACEAKAAGVIDYWDVDCSRVTTDPPILPPTQVIICPALYAPVCGSDGRTYGNFCYAEASGIKEYQSGECPVK